MSQLKLNLCLLPQLLPLDVSNARTLKLTRLRKYSAPSVEPMTPLKMQLFEILMICNEASLDKLIRSEKQCYTYLI